MFKMKAPLKHLTFILEGAEEALPGACTLRVLERVNLSKDLERGAQFDVHGGHEMVLPEQQQGLAVDLLPAELLGDLQAACGATQTSTCHQDAAP